MAYTQMAVRAGQHHIRVFTLSGEPPERWRFARVGCSELVNDRICPDGRSSRPAAYRGSYPDGYMGKITYRGPTLTTILWGAPLKEDSPTMTARSQSRRVFILMATEQVDSLYRSYTDGYKRKTSYTGPILTLSLGEPPKRRGLAHIDCTEPVYTDPHLHGKTAYTGPTLTATRKNRLWV